MFDFSFIIKIFSLKFQIKIEKKTTLNKSSKHFSENFLFKAYILKACNFVVVVVILVHNCAVQTYIIC